MDDHSMPWTWTPLWSSPRSHGKLRRMKATGPLDVLMNTSNGSAAFILLSVPWLLGEDPQFLWWKSPNCAILWSSGSTPDGLCLRIVETGCFCFPQTLFHNDVKLHVYVKSCLQVRANLGSGSKPRTNLASSSQSQCPHQGMHKNIIASLEINNDSLQTDRSFSTVGQLVV